MRHLDSIKIFSIIAGEGAISRAARQMNISVATASTHLDALEAHLCGKLFIRSTRHLVLTDLGRLYLEHIRPVLDQLAKIDRLAINYQKSPQGVLAITTGTAIGRQLIAPIVSQFAAKYPDLKVHVDLSDGFRSLHKGGYDLGIRAGDCEAGNLIQRKLASGQRVLVASPDYLAHAPQLREPNDLAHHTLLLHGEDTCSMRVLEFRIDGVSQSLRFEGSLTSNNAELPTVWLMEGHGIAQKSLWEVADAIAEKKLLRLLQAYEPDPIDLYAVSPFRSGECAKVDLFIDFLRSKMRNGLLPKPEASPDGFATKSACCAI